MRIVGCRFISSAGSYMLDARFLSSIKDLASSIYGACAGSAYHRPVHQRIFHGLMSIFFAGSPTVFAAVDSSDGWWKPAAVRDNNVAMYSRARPGSTFREF